MAINGHRFDYDYLKHVKVWPPPVDKTVFDLQQRCFYPKRTQKLTTNKIYSGHVIRDATGLLKIISQMGQV